jgi:hypothetical protein
MRNNSTVLVNNFLVYRTVLVSNNVQNIHYNNLTGQTFKAFKGHETYKKFYTPIIDKINNSNTSDKNLVVENLINILVILLKECDKDKIIDSCFIIINDLINNVTIGGKSLTNEERIFLESLKNELLGKFQNEIEDFDDLNNSQTDQHVIQPNTQTLIIHETQTNETLNQNQNQQNQLNLTDSTAIIALFRKLAREEASQLISNQNTTSSITQNSINNNANTNSNINNNNNNNKKLTMSEVNNIRQQAYNKYEKIIKTEHHLSMFKTHLDQKTVPKALNYDKFPTPFFSDDPVYVDEHNKIINEAQNKIKMALVERCTAIINATNVELCELKSTLDNYEGSKERFFDNVKASVTNSLKSFLDAGNQKLIRLTKNYFEDHLATEYEVTEKTNDEFQQNYLSLTNENDSQYQIKQKYNHYKKEKDNENSHNNKTWKRKQYNQTSNNNYNYTHNSNDYQTKKYKQKSNENKQNNYQNYYNNSKYYQNKKQSNSIQSDVNFRQAQNHAENG